MGINRGDDMRALAKSQKRKTKMAKLRRKTATKKRKTKTGGKKRKTATKKRKTQTGGKKKATTKPCKNDSKSTYKGTEPSPKGLGYCAHVEKIGTVKKGLDGNKWIVKETANGSHRWLKHDGKILTKTATKGKSGLKKPEYYFDISYIISKDGDDNEEAEKIIKRVTKSAKIKWYASDAGPLGKGSKKISRSHGYHSTDAKQILKLLEDIAEQDNVYIAFIHRSEDDDDNVVIYSKGKRTGTKNLLDIEKEFVDALKK